MNYLYLRLQKIFEQLQLSKKCCGVGCQALPSHCQDGCHYGCQYGSVASGCQYVVNTSCVHQLSCRLSTFVSSCQFATCLHDVNNPL